MRMLLFAARRRRQEKDPHETNGNWGGRGQEVVQLSRSERKSGGSSFSSICSLKEEKGGRS